MNDDWIEYQELRDRILERRASDSEVQRFEELVIVSDEMKRDYVEHVHQEAALVWEDGSIDSGVVQDLVRDDSRSSKNYWWRVALAATVLLTLGSAWTLTQHDPTVATLSSTDNCQWGDSTLPTNPGQRLPPGRMRLSQGIAKLRFPYVDVTLEGPVDFEIIGEAECFVHAGRVHSSVQPGGEGFVIETPSARFIDRGTEFGVNVLPSGISDLRVFEGQVDAQHTKTGTLLEAKTDASLRLSLTGIERLDDVVEPAFDKAADPSVEPLKSVQISTAVGNGADAYLSPDVLPAASCMTTALLVKRPPIDRDAVSALPWRRKAFLSFDLSLLDKTKLRTAKLQLCGVPTDIGYAALIPDATFSIYGVSDESEENWTEETISWISSPAQLDGQLDLDPQKVVLLGKFVVPQSRPTGLFTLEGTALVEFLRGDTNGRTTLVIIPETSGTGACYVHGFASKRHPDLPPPTLRLGVQK